MSANICRLDAAPIKIIVGCSKDTYYIHESLLRKPGTFFDTALSKDWQEGQTCVIELPEDDPVTVRLYFEWLYTGKISCKSERPLPDFSAFAALYSLGEKILDRNFQDCVIDAIIGLTHAKETVNGVQCDRCFPSFDAIDRIYQDTPAGTPARRLLVDLYVNHGNLDHPQWDATLKQVNHEFLVDFTFALLRRHKTSRKDRTDLNELEKMPACAYHHHAKNEPCPAHRGDG